MRAMIVGLLFVAACGKVGDTNETDDSDVQETDTDTDTDTEAPCVMLKDGEWYGAGSAFGMRMGVTLTMDASDCTFTLTEWSMDMGPIADAGTVAGDEVTLAGPDPYWASCVGTAEADGESVDGVCSDDDAAFQMSFRN